MTEKTSEKLPFFEKILLVFVYFFIFFTLYLSGMLASSKDIAIYKAKNPNNRLQGCLYYTGISSKGLPSVRINHEHESVLHPMLIKEFPAYSKGVLKKITKHRGCHKISYLVINFTLLDNILDYDVFEFYYIYDFIE